MRCLLPLPLFLLIRVTGISLEPNKNENVQSLSEGDFSYKDPDKWGGVCQTGTSQSPIDLRLKLASFERVDPMFFLKYEEAAHFEIQNNGHTIKLKLDQPCSYMIAGGKLPDIYYLDHIHFHWRSEHLVDGKRFAVEAHFVHYRKDFSNVGEAANQPDGIAVLGVLFEESKNENKVLKEMLPYFTNSSKWEIPKYHLAPRNLLPKYKSSFFRYRGSLTTPPCSESVVWTVFRDKIPISKSQIEQLHSISFNGDGENFRPVQKLNRRPLSVMTFEDRKSPLNCARPSHADKAFCFLLTLAGVIPAIRA